MHSLCVTESRCQSLGSIFCSWTCFHQWQSPRHTSDLRPVCDGTSSQATGAVGSWSWWQGCRSLLSACSLDSRHHPQLSESLKSTFIRASWHEDGSVLSGSFIYLFPFLSHYSCYIQEDHQVFRCCSPPLPLFCQVYPLISEWFEVIFNSFLPW